MDNQRADWQDSLEAIVSRQVGGRDGSHDLGHLRRVLKNAYRIADEIGKPVCRLTLLAAAMLHDIVSVEKDDPRRSQASCLAAVEARRLLEDAQFPQCKLDGVVHAIEAHSYSAGITTRTVEAMILQDADRLDALGAIGIARLFYVGGRIGTALYDADDILASKRQLDDLRYSLDHIQTKLLKLPNSMKTEPGRRIANERAGFIQEFMQRMCQEAGVVARREEA